MLVKADLCRWFECFCGSFRQRNTATICPLERSAAASQSLRRAASDEQEDASIYDGYAVISVITFFNSFLFLSSAKELSLQRRPGREPRSLGKSIQMMKRSLPNQISSDIATSRRRSRGKLPSLEAVRTSSQSSRKLSFRVKTRSSRIVRRKQSKKKRFLFCYAR